MKRLLSQYVMDRPLRRPLKIFATDPMLGRTAGNRVTIDVPNEVLQPGPRGARIEVVDYDGAAGHDRFYPPVDLDDPAILMQGGLEPTESDPRFHQQMVYAVAMKTLDNFERSLGRRIRFRRSNNQVAPLRLFPHGFHGANAYFDPDMHAILFGYFRADSRDPGANLPGQNVFTCLSHDIIAHEMTHAIVHRMRRRFLEPSNVDVLAFHEAFSDIVALFQHFSFQELLREQIQRTRTDLRKPTMLVEMARQFGYAMGSGRALRSALDKPDAKLYATLTEPHARGSILVAAVFDAFFTTYQRRIRDLVRIATGGTGTLPEGDLHPDLVSRIASEAARTAQQILTMCVRAFDYLPPVDVTFGDYLRALVTADYELVREDALDMRGALIEAFRLRGIYPENVTSLAEESLLWENAPESAPAIPNDEIIKEVVSHDKDISRPTSAQQEQTFAYKAMPEVADRLKAWASDNRAALRLDASEIVVAGFHSTFRMAPDGQLVIEFVAQFVQEETGSADQLGGIPFRGGSTVVAAADGRVRYVVTKSLPTVDKRAGMERRDKQAAYLAHCDEADSTLSYCDDEYYQQRMVRRAHLGVLHGGGLR